MRVVALGDYTSLSWWRTLFPWLPESADITEPSISPVVPEGYVNVLVAGQIQQWMRDDYEVDAGRFTITCKAGFTVDGKTFTEKALTRSFTLTNAATKRYKGRSSAGWREPIPESLAADFYAAVPAMFQHHRSGGTPPSPGSDPSRRIRFIERGLPRWLGFLAIIKM